MISGFWQEVLDAGLVDVPMQEYHFSWFKSLGSNRAVEENLDRALFNNDSCILFPEAKVNCLTIITLDHYSILLCYEESGTSQRTCNKFKFENVWLTELGFNEFFIHQ